MNPFDHESMLAVGPPYDSFLEVLEFEPDLAWALREGLAQAPAALRRRWLAGLEGAREQARLPAAVVYRAILECPPDTTCFEWAVRQIEAEGGFAARQILDDVASRAGVGAEACGQAAKRMGLRGLTVGPPPPGAALLSSCCGSGRGWGLFEWRTPHDRWVFLSFQVDVLNGLVTAHRCTSSTSRLAELRGRMEECERLRFVTTSPSALAGWVVDNARRAVSRGRRIDVGVWSALHIVEGIAPIAMPQPEPASEMLSLAVLEEMMVGPAYDDWLFDRNDLRAAGIGLDRLLSRRVAQARAHAARRLAATPQVMERLAAMLQAQAVWHLQGEEVRQAGRLARLRESLGGRPEVDPLLRIMLDRTRAALLE